MMHAESWRAKAALRWRLPALLLAILISVTLPWIISRMATDSAHTASDSVAHSMQVRTTLYQLLFYLRDTEAATYSMLQGMPDPTLARRIEQARTQINPLATRLRELTINSPDQQVRMGKLQSVVAHRVALMQQARTRYRDGNTAGAYQALGEAADLFPYSALADDIAHTQVHTTDRREDASRSLSRTAEVMRIGAVATQLLLLGLVVVVSERAMRRRLHAEQVSQQAVARAERIVQTVREPMAMLDGRLHLLMVNTAFEELYGTAPESTQGALAAIGAGAWASEALGQRLLDVIHRDRELWDYAMDQTTIDGVSRHMLINARRMPAPNAEEPAILLSVSDVTTRVLAENRVNELNEELEGKLLQLSEANHELEAFSYSVSHDLRAPLRHIAGFSDKLRNHVGPGADEKTAHYLEVIADAARRMAGLIDGLLGYSRLGRGALRTRPVDMQELAEDARAVALSEFGERNVEWRIAPLPVVLGDADMLRTVWQNLLGNALKYTAGRNPAVIEVTTHENPDGQLVFNVIDNGAGFDMAYADKLFGVFQRMHKASQFPGSGIGLANVRRIIGRHGGKVWADAQPDHGASFHFSLPPGGTGPGTGMPSPRNQ